MKKTKAFLDTTKVIDKEMTDKISLWMLTILIELGGMKKFIRDFSFYEDVAIFLGLNSFVNQKNISKTEIVKILKKRLLKLSSKKNLNSSKILQDNLNQLSQLLSLDKDELRLLEFCVAIANYQILKKTASTLKELNVKELKIALSIILGIKLTRIEKITHHDSILYTSYLLRITTSSLFLSTMIRLGTNSTSKIMYLDGDVRDIFKYTMKEVTQPKLTIQNYNHIKEDIKIIKSILSNAVKYQESGVNILFYGVSGVGKTQLAKLVSNEIDKKLYEISSSDMNDIAKDNTHRLKSYKRAQSLLEKSQALILYDNVEEMSNLVHKTKQQNKTWFNEILRSNKTPTIWTTNHIQQIDNTLLQRFSFIVELPIPRRDKKEELFRVYSQNQLDEKILKRLSKNPNMSPAMIENSIKIAKKIPNHNFSKTVYKITKNSMKAQGFKN